MGFFRHQEKRDVAIASGDDTSEAIDVRQVSGGAVQFPAAFTGTGFTVLGSVDGETFNALRDKIGTVLSESACEADALVALPDEIYGVGWIKIKSNDSEGADRTLMVCLKS